MSEHRYPPETYKKAKGARATSDLQALEPVFLDGDYNADSCAFRDHNAVALHPVKTGDTVSVYPGRISDMAITDKIRLHE